MPETMIGSCWCECGKHKKAEQVVCFGCFASLPLMVKYGLCSLHLETREKSVAFATRAAMDNREGSTKPASPQGEIFQ
jgi:hypothetical protein